MSTKNSSISPLRPKFNSSKLLSYLILTHCFTLYIYFTKTLLDNIENFFNICIFRLFKIKLSLLSLSDQSKILKPLNILPFKLRFFYRISIFSYKIMNGKYLPNFFEKLNFNDNTKNLRSKEILFVPRELTKFGSHILSIFLPKFLNVVLKFYLNVF